MGIIGNLLPFTFFILQKPEIASLVHFFTLGEEDGELDRVKRRPWPAGSEEVHNVMKPVVKAAAHSSNEESALFDLVLRENDNDIAVLSLVLPALRRLRRLYMTMSFDYRDNKYILPLFHRAGAPQTPFDTRSSFTELTDIMISGSDLGYAAPPGIFLACCTLPTVERIYGHRLGNDRGDDVTQLVAMLPTKSSNIVSIELRQSKLHPALFSQLLAACKKLKTLIYEICCRWAWVPVKTREIRDALEPHEEWLEELCLDREAYFSFGDDEERGPLALSFKEFKTLKHLKVAPVYLFGDKRFWFTSNSNSDSDIDEGLRTHLIGRLPESLQKLHITFCEQIFSVIWAADELEGLLKRNETCVPNLNELVLEGQFEGCEDSRELLDGVARILRVADAKGIETVVLHNPKTRGDVERAWGMDETVEWEACTYNQMNPRTMLKVRR